MKKKIEDAIKRAVDKIDFGLRYYCATEPKERMEKMVRIILEELEPVLENEIPVWVSPPKCPRCEKLLKPTDNKYGDWECGNHEDDGKCLWLDYELTMILVARLEKLEKAKNVLTNGLKTQKIVMSGYAGILSNGNIVDCREHPSAIPMQKNDLLGIPESKAINN